MIIQCSKCHTRYRFDDRKIGDNGIWVRCTRCGYVFFEETPSAAKVIPSPPTSEKDPDLSSSTIQSDDFQNLAELLDDINRNRDPLPAFEGATTRKRAQDTDRQLPQEHREYPPPETMDEERKKPSWPWKRITILLILLIILASGVFFRYSPDIRETVFGKVGYVISSIEEAVGLQHEDRRSNRSGTGIDFIDVRESFHQNWIAGSILVIEGSAVNSNRFDIARIKVKGKLLGISKDIIAETESFCGTILTEEELRNLTAKEIGLKLAQTPSEKAAIEDVIPPQGHIPFMLVFTSPADEAGEFIVELAEIVPAIE